MKGLGVQKTADVIDDFVKRFGSFSPRRAIFCTYDFDPARFEAVILPRLTRPRRWFRTLVLADGSSLQGSAASSRRASGSLYELAPVRLDSPGVFHPKLIFLQAGSHILVGVGSGNLTAGGLGGNLELMLFDTNLSESGRALSSSACDFLSELLNKDFIRIPTQAREFLARVCASAERVPGGPVLHSLREPLWQQISRGLSGRCDDFLVVSPWHSGAAETDGVEPKVIKAIVDVVGRKVAVYTQGFGNAGPNLGKNVDVRILAVPVPVGQELGMEDGEEPGCEELVDIPSRLHAKAYLASYKGGARLWLGSANCTAPALLKSASKGNVEILACVDMGADSRSRLRQDLDSMFRVPSSKAALPSSDRKSGIPGAVLCGYMESWEGSDLILDILPSDKARSVRITRSRSDSKGLQIEVAALQERYRVSAQEIGDFLRGSVMPATLWEVSSGGVLPFPVSVPCSPLSDDVELLFEDVLEELGGCVPRPFRRRVGKDSASSVWSDEEENDLDDPDIKELTDIAHEAPLDRLARRVEWLRRRVQEDASSEQVAFYKSLICRLDVPDEIRRVLVDHLSRVSGAY